MCILLEVYIQLDYIMEKRFQNVVQKCIKIFESDLGRSYMDRNLEFCEWYKNRLIECLTSDNLFTELSFVLIGIDLMLRQKEISMLTWEQVDYDKKVIKDVKVSKKLVPMQTELFSYGDMVMTEEVVAALKQHQQECSCKTGRIFPINNRYVYYENIQRSIGDISFNGMRLRQIGLSLKVADLNRNN